MKMEEIQAMRERLREKYKGYKLPDLIAEMDRARGELDRLSEIKSESELEHDLLRLELIPTKMDDEGIENIKIEGIGRVSLTGDVHASILKEHRDAAHAWLEEHGYGDLIQATVNSSTLKAFVKERLEAGDMLPAELFKVTPFTRAAITKR
jgi:hypothetical protein